MSALSQINYFSIVANSNGSLNTTSENGASLSELQAVVTAAHAASPPVAVSITVDLQTPFLTIAQNPTYTASFVANLISFCSEYKLDGIDLDFEPARYSLTGSQQTSYGNLVAAIHAQTKANGLTLSAAVQALSSDEFQAGQAVIPKANIPDIDYYYIMDYDLDYNSSAPYTASITYLSNWANYLELGGVSKSRLLMGVPFYGRAGTGWGNATSVESYGLILSSYYAINGCYPDVSLDTASIAGTTWGFNGIALLSKITPVEGVG